MVILTDDDLAELPSTSSREIAVEKFVPSNQIDPMLFEKSYYLEPEKTGAKPYALLRQALLDADRMAVVTVALRQRTSIAVLRVRPDDVIVLQTMMWPDEIRTPDFKVEAGEVKDAEVKMAHMLVETLAGDFDADEFEDDYAEAVEALVKAKIEGGEVKKTATSTKSSGEVVDLLAALQRSVDAAKTARGESAADEDDRRRRRRPRRRPPRRPRPRRRPRRRRPPRRPRPRRRPASPRSPPMTAAPAMSSGRPVGPHGRPVHHDRGARHDQTGRTLLDRAVHPRHRRGRGPVRPAVRLDRHRARRGVRRLPDVPPRRRADRGAHAQRRDHGRPERVDRLPEHRRRDEDRRAVAVRRRGGRGRPDAGRRPGAHGRAGRPGRRRGGRLAAAELRRPHGQARGRGAGLVRDAEHGLREVRRVLHRRVRMGGRRR